MEGYDYANVRSEPNGEIIDRVFNGEVLFTTGRYVERGGYNWAEVSYGNGRYGWVAENLMVDIVL